MSRLTCHYCKYRVILSLLSLYACATCAVTCIFLWGPSANTSSSKLRDNNVHFETGESNLVHYCANSTTENGAGCNILQYANVTNYISSGWTKSVYQATLYSKRVAVKTVNEDGKQIRDCVRMKKSYTVCHNEAVRTLVREIENLRLLSHSNIIKPISYCVNVESAETNECLGMVVLVTELGEPVDNIKLLQLPWQHRFKLLSGLIRLLHFLAHNPFGSIRLLDMRRTQFVITDGVLKLADLDDIEFQEPSCQSQKDCRIQLKDIDVEVECRDARCLGFNEQYNRLKAFTEFGPYLFIDADVPQGLRGTLNEIRSLFKKTNSTTNELIGHSQKIAVY